MITIIAAISDNNALGKDNKLLWHLPNDFKRFKKVTTGHNVIMGRKTFQSIGNKALPKRTNIIITRQKSYDASCIILADSLRKALRIAQNDKNPYILGGGMVYKEAMKYADRLDLTIVHHTFEADTFFPEIDLKVWKEVSREFHAKDTKHKYDYSFVMYERKGVR